MSEPTVLDLTFIEDERRRVQIAEDMWLVWDKPVEHENYRPDGLKWDHLCSTYDDPEDGPTRKRIAAHLGNGHVIVQDDPVTIEGSLLCLGCGLHGFVRDSNWVPA